MSSILSHRAIRSGTRYVTRRSNNKKAKTKTIAPGHVTDGFLKYRFLPIVTDSKQLLHRTKVEKAFFTSLHNLSAIYGFTPLDVTGKVYPYNIWLAFRDADYWVKQANEKLTTLIVKRDGYLPCIATAKPFDIGSSLYYLPLEPLYNLLQTKKCNQSALLLLSVCAYLSQAARIPCYLENDYLGYCHTSIREWLDNEPGEWDEDVYDEATKTMEAASKHGKRLYQRMKHPSHLKQFQARLNRFKPAPGIETAIAAAGKLAFELYTTYPGRSFHQSIYDGFIHPEAENTISPDQYVSFAWAAGGWLEEQLFEYVNSDLQEMVVADEPVALQFFDQPQTTEIHDLNFEKKLFTLLGDVATILNDLV